MEVLGRLGAVEKDLRNEKAEHKEGVEHLNATISSLTLENQLLRDDNARLKSILDNRDELRQEIVQVYKRRAACIPRGGNTGI